MLQPWAGVVLMDESEAFRHCAVRAATDPALWPESLLRLGHLTGSDMTLLEHHSLPGDLVTLGFTDRPDILIHSREPYEQHYASVNPRWPQISALSAGTISHDGLLGSAANADCEFYRDFLSPYGLRYFAATTLVSDAEQKSLLVLQRAPDRGPYDAQEIALFSCLLADLGNALSIHIRLGGAALGPAMAEALNRLTDPIAIVDGQRHAYFVNQALHTRLIEGDLVTLEQGRINAPSGEIACALGAAMASGLGKARSNSLMFRVAALDPESARSFARPGIRLFCLVIDDPRRLHWVAIDEAIRLWGLTRCEAMVGSLLATGLGIDAIAARLQVSRNTVRSHLAALRDKLDAHSSLAVAAEMRRVAMRLFEGTAANNGAS